MTKRSGGGIAWIALVWVGLQAAGARSAGAVEGMTVSDRSADTVRMAPGSLWIVSAAGEIGRAPTVTLLGETHPMYRYREKWIAPVALYSRTPAGPYVAILKEGGNEVQRIPFRIVAADFPTQWIKMAKDKSSLQSPELLKKEREILEAAFARSGPTPLWRGAFQLPLAGTRVTSDFGRTRYVNGKFWSRHGGLDLAAPLGKVAVAGNSGRVILARRLWMRGNTLVIDHGVGVVSVYNHLSAFLVREGDPVAKGQAVAKVGATGFVTGPHLHWEIRAAGTPTNPWPLLKSGIALP